MKRSKYCIKKSSKFTPPKTTSSKQHVSSKCAEIISPSDKVIIVPNILQDELLVTEKHNIETNKISNKVERNDNDNENDNNNENDNGKNKKKKPEVSKKTIELAISILRKVDPKQKKSKEDVISELSSMRHELVDISYVGAIDYLLKSFENLEETLKEYYKRRKIQEHKLLGKRLEDNVFKDKICLDSDQREPDENDRIFRSSKKLFSGGMQKYKQPDNKMKKKFQKLTSPKRDLNKLKQFNI